MPINVLRIDPDGTVTTHEDADPLKLGAKAFDGQTDVVTCRNPFVSEVSVGVVHDWGAVGGMPLNEKAWALYGRSPIFGPMFYSLDSPYAPLPDDLVAMLLSDEDWIDPRVRAEMVRIVAQMEG